MNSLTPTIERSLSKIRSKSPDAYAAEVSAIELQTVPRTGDRPDKFQSRAQAVQHSAGT
jgi:hypothetical protein